MSDEKLQKSLEAAEYMCSPAAYWGKGPRESYIIQRELVYEGTPPPGCRGDAAVELQCCSEEMEFIENRLDVVFFLLTFGLGLWMSLDTRRCVRSLTTNTPSRGWIVFFRVVGGMMAVSTGVVLLAAAIRRFVLHNS